MPFPMLPHEPVYSTGGRFSLPADTESAITLCQKVIDFYVRESSCIWGAPDKIEKSNDKLRKHVRTRDQINKVSLELGHV